MKLLLSLVILTVASVSNVALAEDAPVAQRSVITLGDTIVYGHLPQPLASFEIDRIAPKMTLTEVRVHVMERIESAIYDGLF